jgi:acetyl esterase/lipase
VLVVAALLLPVTVTGLGVEALGERTVVLTDLATTADQQGTQPMGRLPRGTVTVTPTATPAPTTTPTPKRRTPVPSPPASTPVAPRGVKAAAQDLPDLAYAGASPAQRLDLYLPKRTGAPVPLVIVVHGGAFKEGDKGDATAPVDALRARGYAVASLNYRLSGEAPFPAGGRDVKAAVRWLRAHAASYGLHPGQFAAWGESAGGYLAVMLGATGDQRTTLDDATLGNATHSSAVQAVVDLFGPANFLSMDAQATSPGGCPGAPQVHDAEDSPESLWLGAAVQTVPATARAANPISYLARARTLPPFMIAHGAQDCLVPHGQSLELVAALKKRGAKVTFTLLAGAGHGGPEFDRLQDPAIAFLDRTFGRA